MLGRAFAHRLAAWLGQLGQLGGPEQLELGGPEQQRAIQRELADGIAPGTAMTFRVSRSRLAYPVAAYSNKLKKKLVNYYGFGL